MVPFYLGVDKYPNLVYNINIHNERLLCPVFLHKERL